MLTCGGVMSGYCAMGSMAAQKSPPSKIMRARQMATMGRRMKKAYIAG